MYSRALRNKWALLTVLRLFVAIGVVSWSASVTKFSPVNLVQGFGSTVSLVARMLPPNWSVWSQVIRLSLETIHIAIMATLLAVMVSFPLALLAARNTTPNLILYNLVRNLLNLLRGIPELIFALLFVVAVGLGPFAGVLALATHTTGVLGKIIAEYIEDAKKGPQEAMASTGASRLQVIIHGILPQVVPNILAMCFYRFEVNVRSATVLGFVGAGGIGFYLLTAMRLLNYNTAVTCVLAILIMVSAIDYIGSYIRLSKI